MSRVLSLVSVPDDELLERLSTLVDRHRRCEAELVAHIAEVDARRLYLGKACSSMFCYCTEVLHLSEHEAYLRIACARASRRFPVLLDMLADGRLHLSAIAKLAPHLTDEGAEALLQRAVHRTKREVEELVAEVAPRPDVAACMRKLPPSRRSPSDQLGPDLVPGATAPAAARSATSTSSAITEPATTAVLFTNSEPTAFEQTGPEVVEAPAARAATPGASEAPRAVLAPIAPARFKVQFTASADLRDKLERAQALLRKKNPDCDLAEVVDEAVTLLLGKLEGRRFGTTDKPRKTLEETDTSARSRYVPAAVRRAVFERDGGQCAFVDEATGRRCSCTDPGQLEYHHRNPFARGSGHDVDEIELRCRAHNQYQAELDFGADKMARHRRGTTRAGEPQAAYRLRPRAHRTPSRASPGRVRRSRRSASPVGSPATEPVVEAPRVVDRRGAAGPLPGCPRPKGGDALAAFVSPWARPRSVSNLAPGLSSLAVRVGGTTDALRAIWGERAPYAARSITCGLTDLHGADLELTPNVASSFARTIRPSPWAPPLGLVLTCSFRFAK
jgi:hypothetical protein